MAGSDIPYYVYQPNQLSQFFDQGPPGPWMRFINDRQRTDGIAYFDSNDNVEVYGSVDFAHTIIPLLEQYSSRPVTFTEIQISPASYPDLVTRRRCLFQVRMNPSANDLKHMWNAMSSDCDDINSALTTDDKFGGVDVREFKTGSRRADVETFLAHRPNSESSWMLWGTTGKSPYVYHDSDDNVEVYSEDGIAVPGIPKSGYHIYVQITPGIKPLWLQIARAQLYKKTNNLYATQEQLDDMVALIAQNPPRDNDLKKWGESLYKQGPKVDKTTWTFEPPRGSLPQKAQFYFNPKPLKKGDQSEYDNGTRNDNTTLKEMVGEGNWDKGWA